MNPVGNILHRSFNNGKKNILSHICHERYQSQQRDVNVNMYLLRGSPGLKDRWVSAYAEIPDNFTILNISNNPLETIPGHIEFDAVLSHHKFGSFQEMERLSKLLHVPHISVDHTYPLSLWPQNYRDQLKLLKSDHDIFISEQSRDAWGWDASNSSVIHHGFDDTIFIRKPNIKREKKVISVNNDWINRGAILGFDIFQKAVLEKGIPHIILGDTKGLSSAATSTSDLVDHYNSASIYVNCTRESPLPCVLCEAALCELPIVTTDNLLISETITHGHDGFKTNDPKEMTEYINLLLSDDNLRETMGANARKTIQSKFPLDKFVQSWDNVFNKAAQISFRG